MFTISHIPCTFPASDCGVPINEESLTEEDFLDDELSGDEDWAGE
jgi:hypothetical protein